MIGGPLKSQESSNQSEEQPILSFEEFSSRDHPGHSDLPHYSNFWLYFGSGFCGEAYRTSEVYKKLADEHPELAASLCNKIQNLPYITSENLKPFDEDLYKAYKIMRSYGASDRNLFS